MDSKREYRKTNVKADVSGNAKENMFVWSAHLRVDEKKMSCELDIEVAYLSEKDRPLIAAKTIRQFSNHMTNGLLKVSSDDQFSDLMDHFIRDLAPRYNGFRYHCVDLALDFQALSDYFIHGLEYLKKVKCLLIHNKKVSSVEELRTICELSTEHTDGFFMDDLSMIGMHHLDVGSSSLNLSNDNSVKRYARDLTTIRISGIYDYVGDALKVAHEKMITNLFYNLAVIHSPVGSGTT